MANKSVRVIADSGSKTFRTVRIVTSQPADNAHQYPTRLLVTAAQAAANPGKFETVQDGTANYVAGRMPTILIAGYTWTMDVSVPSAVLRSGGSGTVNASMSRPGTLVDMLVTAVETVDDTGHIFVDFGAGSVSFAFLNPPDPPLAQGASLSTLDQGFGGIPALGFLPAGTAMVVSTNGLTNAQASAAVTLTFTFLA